MLIPTEAAASARLRSRRGTTSMGRSRDRLGMTITRPDHRPTTWVYRRDVQDRDRPSDRFETSYERFGGAATGLVTVQHDPHPPSSEQVGPGWPPCAVLPSASRGWSYG